MAEQQREQTALALQRELQDTRAELVADIDRLRDVVRERVSIRHILHTHPRLTQALSIALGVVGIASLAMIWRASTAKHRH